MTEKTPVVQPAATDQKILAALATIPLVGLIMFYVMKDATPLVKSYAKQSNFLLLLWIVSTILGSTLIALPIAFIVGLLELAAWIMLVINAWQEKTYILPVVGEYFDKLLK